MRRKQTDTTPSTAPTTNRSAHVIDPCGVYLADDVRVILKLKTSSLRREIREGRLRVSKRCGRYYFLGEQLLDWLRSGEKSTTKKRKGESA